MRSMNKFSRMAFMGGIALCAAAAANCGVEKHSAPALAGPSEFGTSITVTVNPDVVSRDGESQAQVIISARNPQGQPVAGLPMSLSLSPANGGLLSAAQVTTAADGRAIAVYTAPSLSTAVASVMVGATPIGSNFDNAVIRSARVALAGPSFATPLFTVVPGNPERFQITTFDGSGTQLNGSACGGDCQYTWRMGSEATLTGQFVTYRFQQEQAYPVTLEVTAPGGVVTQSSRNVSVSAAPLPVAVMTVSPASPVEGQTAFFNGSGSTAANGSTITEWTWDFGNGQTGSGVSATSSYATDGTYVVRLTVKDSNGLTGTTTQGITVRNP